VKFWSAASGRLIVRTALLSGKDGDLFAACGFAANGQFVAAIDPDGGKPTVVRVDPATGSLLHQVRLPEILAAVHGVFSPDGSRFATVEGSFLHVFDTLTGRPLFARAVKDAKTRGIAFSPDGSLLAHVENQDVAVRDAKTGTLVRKIDKRVPWVAFTPDGKNLWLALDRDAYPILFDMATGEDRFEGRQSRDHKTDRPNTLPPKFFDPQSVRPGEETFSQFEPAETVLTRAGAYRIDRNGTVEFTDWATGKSIAHFTMDVPTVAKRALSPDGSTLAIATLSGSIRLWDLRTKTECPQSSPFELPDEFWPSGAGRLIFRNPHGRYFAWDYRTGGRPVLLGRDRWDYMHVDVHPTRPWIVYSGLAGMNDDSGAPSTGGLIRAVTVRDLTSGSEVAVYPFPSDLIGPPQFTGKGEWVVFREEEDQLHFWKTGGPCRTVRMCAANEQIAEILPVRDVPLVVIHVVKREQGERKCENRLLLMNAATAGVAGRIDLDPTDNQSAYWKANVSADGRRIAVLRIDVYGELLSRFTASVTVFDGLTCRRVNAFRANFDAVEHFEAPPSPVVSPDGRLVVFQTGREGFTLYEIATGKPRLRFTVPAAKTKDPAFFSHDGSELLVATDRYLLTAWDVRGTRSSADPLPAGYSAARAWVDLGNGNSAVALRGMRYYAARPAETVDTFRTKLPRVAPVDPERIRQMTNGWREGAYWDREKTSAALRPYAGSSRAVFTDLAKTDSSAEVRSRAKRLLAESATPDAAELRAIRAVEVLEWVDSPDGRILLKEWSTGAEGNVLTDEATAALNRLKASGGR
jgi:WD40 repeat protein